MNSETKANNQVESSEAKTPLKMIENFQVNPFSNYQNEENFNEEEGRINLSNDRPKTTQKEKEWKVPCLFQTKPYKEVLEQVKKLNELYSESKIKIHEKQIEQISEELKTLRVKPEISKNSKIIMQKKTYLPLYQRTEEILKKREDKLDVERKKQEDQKEALEKNLTFKPDLQRKPETFRNFEEFENSMKVWDKTKKEKIAKKQFINLEKEVEVHPFKPEINEKSRKILQRKGNTQEKKVENRLLENFSKEKIKKKQLFEATLPDFKPKLNNKTDQIVKARNAKTNYFMEFLQSPEKMEKLNIQITTRGIELSLQDKET